MRSIESNRKGRFKMRKTLKGAALAALSLTCLGSATAGETQYIGDVILNGSNYCPRGSMPAEGQQMAVSSNAALFSLLGTMYGGNGVSTFNLPDLRGRVPMGRGQATGSARSYVQGEQAGTETRTISVAEMYAHNHALQSADENTNSESSANAMLGDLSSLPTAAHFYHSGSVSPDQVLNDNSVSMTGQSQALENRQPIIAMRWCIYVEGQYPPRN